MAEGFQTPDGTPVDLDASERQFAAAMASEPGEEHDLPKRADPKPEDAGKPAKKRGRPPKSVQTAEVVQPATPELTKKRAEEVAGTVNAVGGAFLAGAAMTGMTALKADAYSLQGFAEPIGKAAADVAAVDPAFARYIDKSGSGGKVLAYLGLFGTVAGLGAQLAANHHLVKPGTLGAHDPADVIAAYEQSESADADTPQE
jgi:hypothetical protein